MNSKKYILRYYKKELMSLQYQSLMLSVIIIRNQPILYCMGKYEISIRFSVYNDKLHCMTLGDLTATVQCLKVI